MVRIANAFVASLMGLACCFHLHGQSHSINVRPVGAQPLQLKGDVASEMISGIDKFLLRETLRARTNRSQYWNINTTSEHAYLTSVQGNRNRLKEVLGIRAARVDFNSLTVSNSFDLPKSASSTSIGGRVASTQSVDIYAVSWPVTADPAPQLQALTSIQGEGLLLVPRGNIIADVVAVGDADQTPEQICGLEPGVSKTSQFAIHLAQAGCRVIVPSLTSRNLEARNGRAVLTDREYIHRSAFVLGRTIAGYEIQRILAAVDWLEKTGGDRPIGGIGYGEGGHLLALASGIDARFVATAISGSFGQRESMWSEPLDRNLFGFVREFGTYELGLLITPRHLLVENATTPHVEISSGGSAPGKIAPRPADETREIVAKLREHASELSENLQRKIRVELVEIPASKQHMFCSSELLERFLSLLTSRNITVSSTSSITQFESKPSQEARISRRRATQLAQLDRHNQQLLRESSFAREAYMADLDFASLERFQASAEIYRRRFREDVIGEFENELLPANARVRTSWQHEKWTGYEVVLDVFPDVIAFGVLLIPNDLTPGEKRPVVVCQHGLEGRPTDTFLNDHKAYHDFAAKLCEQGFVTFAPQNPYIFKDRFRSLQRKAQPLGRSLFSVIVPQHQQIVNWLKTQPFVDGNRIGFYGLSYGGKSAMRIPALVPDYCLSICSADFNEWVLKNASTRDTFSYVWTGEYEIFEWNLGQTFNYAEMAALICPRPFMVERGHFDGVGVDEWVAFEYAKVRRMYAAKLGIADRTAIEWFAGPHTIHGEDTFEFLRQHLNWRTDSDSK